MSKIEKNKMDLKKIVKQMKIHEKNIAKERDSLRELQMKLEDLLGPIENGLDLLEDALFDFETAIDEMSQVV